MAVRLLALGLLAGLLMGSPAKKKTVGTARGENEDLVLEATIYVDPADVKEVLGDDLGGHYIVAEVKVEPKYGKEIAIDRDDFVLRTDKDGEKAKPFVGSQIAGREALIVTRTADTSNGHHPAISIGGIGGGVGSGSSDNGQANSKIQNAATVKENPLQKELDDKVLVEGKTKSPLSGLLYFPMEKQKMKELELYYGGKENRISLRFK
ncbi:MAG: hypothetical protein ABSB88_17255 [Bryobacteraceae bacterium]|jgi:hypothetical protein